MHARATPRARQWSSTDISCSRLDASCRRNLVAHRGRPKAARMVVAEGDLGRVVRVANALTLGRSACVAERRALHRHPLAAGRTPRASAVHAHALPAATDGTRSVEQATGVWVCDVVAARSFEDVCGHDADAIALGLNHRASPRRRRSPRHVARRGRRRCSGTGRPCIATDPTGRRLSASVRRSPNAGYYMGAQRSPSGGDRNVVLSLCVRPCFASQENGLAAVG